jgi:hypothetical protein
MTNRGARPHSESLSSTHIVMCSIPECDLIADAVFGVIRGLLRAAIRGASQFATHFHLRRDGRHADGVASAQPIGGPRSDASASC